MSTELMYSQSRNLEDCASPPPALSLFMTSMIRDLGVVPDGLCINIDNARSHSHCEADSQSTTFTTDSDSFDKIEDPSHLLSETLRSEISHLLESRRSRTRSHKIVPFGVCVADDNERSKWVSEERDWDDSFSMEDHSVFMARMEEADGDAKKEDSFVASHILSIDSIARNDDPTYFPDESYLSLDLLSQMQGSVQGKDDKLNLGKHSSPTSVIGMFPPSLLRIDESLFRLE